ncbi:MAG TPA: LysM peptidoglycan-binding domain-containing M23 family metallopeptidase [Oligoflexia bacterium]|nr:LysM peptidoglycan-binding domain-containing M23 family metallopeptidase [Oligoflexia bacterium]
MACHNKGGVIHTVEKGETAYRIAHAYQVNLKEIRRANPRLHVNRIYPGQKILIPGVKENKEVQKFIEQNIQKQKTIGQKKIKQSNENISIKNNNNRMYSKNKFSFQWPYQGKVTTDFGKKNGKMHNGIDVQTPSGQALHASEKGTVVYADASLEGYEKMIIVQHGHAVFTVYAYLGQFMVKKGDQVDKGQIIAKTKNEQPSFYHFEIRMQKTALDPEKHLTVN